MSNDSVGTRRLVLFALLSVRGELDGATRLQLSALRMLGHRIAVVTSVKLAQADRAVLNEVADRTLIIDDEPSDARAYRRLLAAESDSLERVDELVFTGNGWFGPIGSFDRVIEQMADVDVDIWRLIETTDREPEVFPLEGFPEVAAPWTWTVVRSSAFRTQAWRDYWAVSRDHGEDEFAEHLQNRGLRGDVVYPSSLGPRGNPGVLAPETLINAGCPVLLRAVFAQFPPLLDRFAVLVRPLLAEVARRGYPLAEIWSAVVRVTPPAALNALAGMLEILPDDDAPVDLDNRIDELRVCVIAHIPKPGYEDELRERLEQIPGEFDLIVTTTDGRKAAKLRTRLLNSGNEWARRADVRVTWVPGGRDIGALVIGCRDVLLSNRYDLIVRVHGREPRRKPLNVREYARRYQLENLLSSPGYVSRVFDLFRRESGLGMVFPPLIHIGYGTLGRGWGAYRKPAEKLADMLGIRVPMDEVSPLAPYGGMWIGRPEALRSFVAHGWTVGDYRRSERKHWVELTRVQERVLTLAAAESGYHCRTVLNREHAEIAFTAAEYKADEMFSTTRGYPAEQIDMLRRAGWTGHGGVVALSRLYLNLNFPRLAALMQPGYRLLRNTALLMKRVKQAVRNQYDDERTP